MPAELAEEVLRRRRAFERLFVAALQRHLAEHPEVRLPMTPKVYVNMCLGAVNWCYKWYRPSGPSTPHELGRQLGATLTATLALRPRAGGADLRAAGKPVGHHAVPDRSQPADQTPR